MEHQDQNRADAYECIYAAVALIERRFDDPQLMVNVLLRVANYFDDALDRETVAASIAANFRHQPNARDRAHQAARFLLEEEAETEVVLRGAKLLLDVAALCSESPSSPPEPAPAAVQAAEEEPMQRFEFNLIVCEPKVLEPDDASAFLEDLREWLELCELAQEQEVEVGYLQWDLQTALSAASHLANGRPAVFDTDKPVGGLDSPGIVQDLTNLACLSPHEDRTGFGEGGRELAKAQLRRRRELEREAREASKEVAHV